MLFKQKYGPKKRLRVLSLSRLVPNTLTLLGLCAGLSSMRAALEGRWEAAVLGVLVAMVTDCLDGPAARLLKAQGEFGAQLDSLADFANFGVVPAFVVCLWAMPGANGAVWALAIFYAICCAMRLARFNVGLSNKTPPTRSAKFFTGVPAPGGAGLLLAPMALSFELGDIFFRSSILNCTMLLVVGFLFVSTLRTFSVKHIQIPRRFAGLAMLAIAGFVSLLLSTPWFVLAAMALGYGLSIVVAQFCPRAMGQELDERHKHQESN